MYREHFLMTFLLLWHCAQGKNLLEEIRDREELSKMAEIIEKYDDLKIFLRGRPFTAFIPNNGAMDRYNGSVDPEDLIEYHLIQEPFRIQDSKQILTSFMTGNPPLYRTKRPSGKESRTGWEDNDYYINNAKVIKANFNLETTEKSGRVGKTQYLHIIDEVLVPTIVGKNVQGATSYPDAKMVLEHPHSYGFRDDFSLRNFKQKVESLGILDIFQRLGNNTFFLSVDQQTNLLLGSEKNPIDKQVIYGHIIPNEVLFTRTSSNLKDPFKTLIDSNTLKVFLKMTKTTNAESQKPVYYVESNTVKTDLNYMKGTAIGRIVKGNIVVRNGVLHLIDRPLMTVAGSIVEYLQQEHGIMSEFYDLMRDYFPDLMNQFSQDSQPLTVFAPSNSAFKRVNKDRLDRTKANSDELQKIVKLHIVQGRLITDDMETNNGLFEKDTLSQGRKLYFSVLNPSDLFPHVTVEGAGVNATITTPNIIAKNGVIHIIDRILGIPSQTVLEKLKSDPNLSSTYKLVSQVSNLKDIFNRTSMKFTFFAPDNNAWEFIHRAMPSAHKKLFMGEYAYHIGVIFERHLIINKAMSILDLEHLFSNKTRRPEFPEEKRVAMQMVKGKIYFAARLRESFGGLQDPVSNYFLEWKSKSAEVYRPDVECVNGVIHVIDKVLMVEGDVTVNASNKMSGDVSTLASILISIALAWCLI